MVKYPRQKLVMTSPVEFPMYGKFKKMELSKEHLLAFWDMVLNRADFNVRTGEKVEDIKKEADGTFTLTTANNRIVAHRGTGAGPYRHAAQTRGQRRRVAQGHVPPDRG